MSSVLRDQVEAFTATRPMPLSKPVVLREATRSLSANQVQYLHDAIDAHEAEWERYADLLEAQHAALLAVAEAAGNLLRLSGDAGSTPALKTALDNLQEVLSRE